MNKAPEVDELSKPPTAAARMIEAVDEFQRVLEGDAIVAPLLATHIALAARAYGVENGMGIDEISGIVLGAGAMYRALTGSAQ
jgi:hypothetical protein